MYTKEVHQSTRFADEDEWFVVVKKSNKNNWRWCISSAVSFFAQSDNLKMQMRFYHLLTVMFASEMAIST